MKHSNTVPTKQAYILTAITFAGIMVFGAVKMIQAPKSFMDYMNEPDAIKVEAASVVPEHHFNTTVPIFVSKEAMHVGLRMIEQGMSDSDILAPYVSCVAREGDSFILLNGSWTVSNVMITDGVNRGCQGWTANEFTAKR